MKILIGYDGSKDADAALAGLASAGLPAKAQALVLTVTTPRLPGTPANRAARKSLSGSRLEREAEAIAIDALRQAKELATRASGELKARFPGWKVTSEAVANSPALGILNRAESWKPDLIVLGSHGHTAFRKLLLGSVSQQVLHHAVADLRINRVRANTRRPLRVIVAVDGSPGSDAAVSAAASRAWPDGTRIKIVAAMEGAGLTDALRDMGRAVLGGKRLRAPWAEKKSAAAEKRFARTGVGVTTSMLVGDPRIVLLREARNWEADCIFLGSRGLAGIDRFLLGSVSSSVATHAPCTVEIVRRHGRGGSAR